MCWCFISYTLESSEALKEQFQHEGHTRNQFNQNLGMGFCCPFLKFQGDSSDQPR